MRCYLITSDIIYGVAHGFCKGRKLPPFIVAACSELQAYRAARDILNNDRSIVKVQQIDVNDLLASQPIPIG